MWLRNYTSSGWLPHTPSSLLPPPPPLHQAIPQVKKGKSSCRVELSFSIVQCSEF